VCIKPGNVFHLLQNAAQKYKMRLTNRLFSGKAGSLKRCQIPLTGSWRKPKGTGEGEKKEEGRRGEGKGEMGG